MNQNRIVKFYSFLQQNNFCGGIVWYQYEYHINITTEHGNIIAHEQDFDLDIAMNNMIKTIQSIGL